MGSLYINKPYLKQDADDLLLRLVLQPKASRDAFVGLLGDELKVAITAPPVDGQANKHLIKFLSKQFRIGFKITCDFVFKIASI